MLYKLPRDEQEIVVTSVRADDFVTAYSSDRLYMAKLDRLCAEFPDVYQCVWTDGQVLGDGLPTGKKYRFPRRFLKFGKPASEARRAAARASIEKFNSGRQG